MKIFLSIIFACLLMQTGSFAQGSMRYVVKEECLAASSDETMKQLNRISNNKDEDGLKKMLVNQTAFILQANTNVELVKGGIATSTIKVIDGKYSGKTMVVSSQFIRKK
jgi:hypothetical protein